jgi:POT family proton-dependent oligopeptide transporter
MGDTSEPKKSTRPFLTAPQPTSKMPGGIPYIVGNEAAERFSFYGMKGILVVYMTQYLFLMGGVAGEPMSRAAATERYHYFTTAVYLCPILGAFLSDYLLGKYRTILTLSIVYCAGHGALAFMGVVGDASEWLLFGLGLIALGSGGIKPCVSAHVGDQFGKSNAHLLNKVFNWFYFSINVGAFLSTLLTPWLLEWYGPHWAFGVPGVLMAIATFLFWMGRHKFIHIPAGGPAFFKETFSRDGVLALMKLGVIYIFVAVFWALFDQTGSSWVLQAEDMDRNWLGVHWLSSQIQAMNPILILCFIPLFTIVIFPAVNRVWELTPIRKISIGLFITTASFAIVAIAQSWIDAGERPSIAWQLLAYAIITAGEVLVSITCLEFSYTQAPRKMKSFVMAFFFMSVSLGNYFTAAVNAYIQVPDTLGSIDSVAGAIAERASEGDRPVDQSDFDAVKADLDGMWRFRASESGEGFDLFHPGHDGKAETEDDIFAAYSPLGVRVGQRIPGQARYEAAANLLEYHHQRTGTLPSQEEAAELLSDIRDPWNRPLRYLLLNSRTFRISSDGPDGEYMTPWDLGFEVTIPAAKVAGEGESMFAFLTPEKSWLDARKAELGLAVASADPDAVPQAQRQLFVGGRTWMQGADYFWFFTVLMLGTAVAFIVVALLYKPKQYLQEEADAAA